MYQDIPLSRGHGDAGNRRINLHVLPKSGIDMKYERTLFLTALEEPI
jgi:hypothetical protein